MKKYSIIDLNNFNIGYSVEFEDILDIIYDLDIYYELEKKYQIVFGELKNNDDIVFKIFDDNKSNIIKSIQIKAIKILNEYIDELIEDIEEYEDITIFSSFIFDYYDNIINKDELKTLLLMYYIDKPIFEIDYEICLSL